MMTHPSAHGDLPALPKEYAFTEHDFRFIADFIYRHTRIVLKTEKRPMVYSRLAKRVRACKFNDFASYIAFLQTASGAPEREELVNAITTNLTSFFRENHHFEHLQKTALPALFKARGEKNASPSLQIWSAGCSSGQEPYSVAMTVLDTLREGAHSTHILATDIDTHMVSLAKKGIYHAASEKEIPPQLQKRYTEKTEHGDIRMKDALRERIQFSKLNLHEAWPEKGPFDVILCRNVVIYFDKDTQTALFNRFADVLAPDGFLYIGHSESLATVTDRFTLIGRTIYVKTNGPHAKS